MSDTGVINVISGSQQLKLGSPALLAQLVNISGHGNRFALSFSPQVATHVPASVPREELGSEQGKTKPTETGNKPNEPDAEDTKLEGWPSNAGQGQRAVPVLHLTSNSYQGPAPADSALSATPAAAEIARDPASLLVTPGPRVLRLFTVKTNSTTARSLPAASAATPSSNHPTHHITATAPEPRPASQASYSSIANHPPVNQDGSTVISSHPQGGTSRGKVQASGSENDRVKPVQSGGRDMPAEQHGREGPRDTSSRDVSPGGDGGDVPKGAGSGDRDKPDEPAGEGRDEGAEASDPEDVTESEETQVSHAEAASLKTLLVS